MKLGEAMYQAGQQPPGGETGQDGASQGSQRDDVVDADFEEVDDDKKKRA